MLKRLIERYKESNAKSVLVEDFASALPVFHSMTIGFFYGATFLLTAIGWIMGGIKFLQAPDKDSDVQVAIGSMLGFIIGIPVFTILAKTLFINSLVFIVLTVLGNALTYLYEAIRRAEKRQTDTGEKNSK